MTTIAVTSLHIYPVKSCAGIDLSSAVITPRGFEYDRNWMIVDLAGEKLTQRECPAMVGIEPYIEGEVLQLQAKNIAPLNLPLNPRSINQCEVEIWGDRCKALDEGERAARWISQVLQRDLRIVRFHPEHTRAVASAWSGETGAHTAFADMLPFLITSEESLATLNREREKIGLHPSPMNRFRPNIVITGGGSYGEDYIPSLRLPGTNAKLELVRPCSRCVIVDTDQDTGAKESKGNLKILAANRKFKNYKGESGVMFGVQALPLSADGQRISVGDILSIEEKTEGLPPLPRLK
jgi:uncharacterized protein YcbX